MEYTSMGACVLHCDSCHQGMEETQTSIKCSNTRNKQHQIKDVLLLSVIVCFLFLAVGLYIAYDVRESLQHREQISVLVRRIENLEIQLNSDSLGRSGVIDQVVVQETEEITHNASKETERVKRQSSGTDGNNNGNSNFNGNGNGNFNGNGNGNSNHNGNHYSIVSRATGSTFIRWGKFSCPQTSSKLYAGYAAAAYPQKGYGGSTELECLPQSPTWHSNKASSPAAKTLLAAVKLDTSGHWGVFRPALEGSVVLCAVCYTKRSPTFVLPGRVNCPNSWIREYYGHLMSTPGVAGEYYLSSKNYCVDKDPDTQSGHANSVGQKLTFVQAGDCNGRAAPCNSYTKGNRIACTVCTLDGTYYG